MTLEQIEARLKEIRSLIDSGAECDVNALTAEVDDLIAKRDAMRASETAKKELRSRVASGMTGAEPQPVLPTETAPESPEEVRRRVLASAEYRTAWLKDLSGRELTDAEQRALATGITANTSGTGMNVGSKSAVVPTETLNQIWDLVSKTHSIVDDVTTLRSGTVIEIPKLTAMTAGSLVAENAAPTESAPTLAKITLAGKDHAAFVDISYAMQKMSIDALESFLVGQLAARIGDLVAKDIVDTITAAVSTPATYNKTSGLAYKDLTTAFGALERVGEVVIYCKRATLYEQIVAMVDSTGRPIFQPDPTGKAKGYVLGAQVKIEDAVAANSLLICDPKKIIRNVVQDVMIETDRNIKTHATTFSAYEREESAVMDAAAVYVLNKATAT